MTDAFRDWDAAYLLGALGADERRAFERHLSTCASCSTAVAELAGIPGLLGKLGRDEAAALLSSSAAAVRAPDLVRGLAASVRRRRRRNRALAGMVALAVAGVLAAFAVGAFAPALQVASPTATAASPTAAIAMDQVTPGVMTADLLLTEKGWGTRFDWTCTYNTAGWQPGDAPASYELVAIDVTGNETIVATWNSTGDKAGGLVASSSVATSAIRSVEIRVAGGDTALVRTNL
ncbi:MAG: hypothetical protein JWP19_826 [Rhodoglobus sp.]|nr:hypothetical protein [Rhodoglobus sp.]